MKIVFLDAATMGDASMDEIAALGEFVCYPSSTAEEARARAADADVVLLNKVIVDQAFLDACPKLKLVCEAGTGINNINVKLCDARGVIVRNVAGYSTESVAQTAWMHILALAGRAFHYNAYAKDGRYSAGSIHVDADHPFTELCGKTLGIVGMGQDPRHRGHGRHRPESRRHRHGLRDEGHLLLHLRHRPLQGLSLRFPR